MVTGMIHLDSPQDFSLLEVVAEEVTIIA
jgi:hypothetical protein